MSGEHHYTIVVGTDFSALADHAIDQALELGSLRAGTEVHAVHVEPDVDPEFERVVKDDAAVTKLRAHLTQRLAVVAPSIKGNGLRRVIAHFRRGPVSENIAQLAADLDADLVIVGSHGYHGLTRLFLGSVAERVSRLARCPVWIIRPKDHAKGDRIPEIEPPCPDCVETRRASDGAKLWCPRHSESPYLAPHVHHYVTDGIYSPETRAYESTPECGV